MHLTVWDIPVKYMTAESPSILNQIQYEKKNGTIGQTSLLALLSHNESAKTEIEYSKADLLSYEKEVLGVYLSGHPLDQYYDEWISTISAKSSDFIFIQGECHVKDGERKQPLEELSQI